MHKFSLFIAGFMLFLGTGEMMGAEKKSNFPQGPINYIVAFAPGGKTNLPAQDPGYGSKRGGSSVDVLRTAGLPSTMSMIWGHHQKTNTGGEIKGGKKNAKESI